MKKTYISPETLVVSLSMCTIVATSGPQIGEGGATGFGMAKEYAGEEGSEGGKNVWDEEW